MLIKFFKSNNASSFVFLPLIAAAIWVLTFIIPSQINVKQSMPFFELITAGGLLPFWATSVIAFLLIISQAFLLNYIINKNEAINAQSYVPALVYIIFMSNSSQMLELHPPLFANLFLLFAISTLISSYRQDVAFSEAFDVGFLISIATLFYFPYIVFLPLIGIGLIIFRPFIWREWVISLIGVLVPYLLVTTYYFWNNTLDYLWYDKMLAPVLNQELVFNFPKSVYVTFGISVFIILISFSKLFKNLNTGAQKSKKSIVLLVWFFILSLTSLLVIPTVSAIYLSALAIPCSVFCANYFMNVKKQWWAEFLFLILVVSVFVNLIRHYF